MSQYADKFEEIFGKLEGEVIKKMTIADIRAKVPTTFSEDEVKFVLKGLKELQDIESRCKHAVLRCECCGESGPIGHFSGSRRRVLSEETKQKRREAGKLGGAPRKIKPVVEA